MTARMLPNGLLRLQLVDGMVGRAAVRELGLNPDLIPADELVRFGAAVADQRMAQNQTQAQGQYLEHEPELSPEALQILAEIKAERDQPVTRDPIQAPDQDLPAGPGTGHPTSQGLRPSVTGNRFAQDSDVWNSSDKSPGHPTQAEREPGTDLDRKKKLDRKRYWDRITRDRDDDQWKEF